MLAGLSQGVFQSACEPAREQSEKGEGRMLPASDNPRKAILLACSVQKPKVTVEFLTCDEPKLRCVIHKNHWSSVPYEKRRQNALMFSYWLHIEMIILYMFN